MHVSTASFNTFSYAQVHTQHVKCKPKKAGLKKHKSKFEIENSYERENQSPNYLMVLLLMQLSYAKGN